MRISTGFLVTIGLTTASVVPAAAQTEARVVSPPAAVREEPPEPTELERIRYGSLEQRRAYEDEVERELEQLDEEVEELSRRRALDLSPSQLTRLRQITDELQSAIAEAKDSLASLKALDGDVWILKRRTLVSEIFDLNEGLAEAKQLFGAA